MAALRPPFMANDMKGLYEKVIRGIFPPIPPGYSPDLSSVISLMLQVNPVNRPTCSKLLEMELVRRHDRGMASVISNNDLLSTIKFVPSMREMSSRLPAANYEKNKRPRGRSIGSIAEDHTSSTSRKKLNVSVERRIEYKQPLRPPGLPPRSNPRNDYSDAQRYKADSQLEKNMPRQNSYSEEKNKPRPLIQAGANVLTSESSTPKQIHNKGNFDRILSEPSLDPYGYYRNK